tara:strand:- start:327 stop:503 length:177 start_codon:yes stop_codon:yes gene_type:complete
MKLLEKLCNLIKWAHPPRNWDEKIQELDIRVRVLEKEYTRMFDRTEFNPKTGEVKYKK